MHAGFLDRKSAGKNQAKMGRIILNQILNKQHENLGTEFVWFRVGKCGGSCENVNELSVSTKPKDFLGGVRNYWFCSCLL